MKTYTAFKELKLNDLLQLAHKNIVSTIDDEDVRLIPYGPCSDDATETCVVEVKFATHLKV